MVRIILSGAFLLIVGLLVGGVVVRFAADAGGSVNSQCVFSAAKSISDLGPIIWYATVLLVGAGLVGYSIYMAKTGRFFISMLIGGGLLSVIALGQPGMAEAAGECLFSDGSVEATNRIGYSDGTYVAKSATLTVCASDARSLLSCDYVADGVNDESQINSALVDCPAGCLVALSEGTFTIGEPAGQSDTTIMALSSGQHIRGAGIGATTVQFAASRDVGADRYLFGVGGGSDYGIVGWSMGDMTLIDQDAQDHCIHVVGAARGYIYNIRGVHSGNESSNDECIQITGGNKVKDIVMQNIYITGYGAACIEFANRVEHVRAYNLFLDSCDKGLNFRNGDATEATDPRDINIDGGSISGMTATGIDVGRGLDLVFENLEVYSNDGNGYNSDNANNTKRVKIINSIFHDNDWEGIYTGGEDESIIASMIYNNGQDGTAANNRKVGLRLGGTDGKIVDTYVFDDQDTKTQLYAVRTDAGASDSRFLGGKLTTGDTGIVDDAGSDTAFIDVDGFVTRSSGASTIANGSTGIAITHGLSVTPVAGDCWFVGAEDPTNTPGANWIDTYTSTQFSANVENDPGASGFDIVWFCDVR